MHVSNLMHVCCEGLHKHMHIRGHRPPTSSGDILLVRPVTILTRVARLLLVLVAICIPALWGAILLGRLAAHTHKHQSVFYSLQLRLTQHKTLPTWRGWWDSTLAQPIRLPPDPPKHTCISHPGCFLVLLAASSKILFKMATYSRSNFNDTGQHILLAIHQCPINPCTLVQTFFVVITCG